MKKVVVIVMVALLLSVYIPRGARAEGGLLSDFFDMIKKWFESSPLGNIFNAPVKRIETIKLGFYPESFEINAADPINMTTASSGIYNFKGKLSIDMKNRLVLMQETGSSLVIKESIGTINVDGLKLNSLDLKGMKLVLTTGNWNETTDNGSVVINDFLGKGTIKDGFIEIEGNVSRVVKG